MAMQSNDIFINIDNQQIKLEGADLEAFLVQREKDLIEDEKNKAIEKARIDAKMSALAKLAALGLTEDEVNGLIS
jgi:hypothetical protein